MQERTGRARVEGTPAREAHENRFYSLSESAEICYWLRGFRVDKCSRENYQSKKTRDRL